MKRRNRPDRTPHTREALGNENVPQGSTKIGHNGGEDAHTDPARVGPPDDRKGRTEGSMAIELSLFNKSVTMLIGHLTSFYGEEATLETYALCARVKSPDIPGGSAINWVVSPGSEQLASGLLRE